MFRTRRRRSKPMAHLPTNQQLLQFSHRGIIMSITVLRLDLATGRLGSCFAKRLIGSHRYFVLVNIFFMFHPSFPGDGGPMVKLAQLSPTGGCSTETLNHCQPHHTQNSSNSLTCYIHLEGFLFKCQLYR